MNKLPVVNTGIKDVSKAINLAGGTSVQRSNALKMGEASKRAIAETGLKKASEDLLSHLTDGQEAELAEFIKKKASWIPNSHVFFGSANASKIFKPKPALSSNLWHMGGGLAGAALGYSSARNDGQGVAGAMGVGAIGGLVGRHGGKAVGREHALMTAGAKAEEAAKHFDQFKETQKATGKFIDSTHGANATAQHLIDQQKARLFTPGQNVMETGGNILKGGLAHIQEFLHNTANPGSTAEEAYKKMVGSTKATHNITEAQGKFQHAFDTNEAQMGLAHKNRAMLAQGGAQNIEQHLARLGAKPIEALNSPDILKNPHVVRMLREQNVHHNFYDVKPTWLHTGHKLEPKAQSKQQTP